MQAPTVLNRSIVSSNGHASPVEVELLKLSLPPEPQFVAFARKTVREVMQQLPMSNDSADDVLLAVGEACNNAVLYGASRPNDPLSIICRLMKYLPQGSHALEIDVRNHGAGVHPKVMGESCDMPLAEELTDHGRGLPLMYHLMDSVQFLSENGDTVVRLTKNLT